MYLNKTNTTQAMTYHEKLMRHIFRRCPRGKEIAMCMSQLYRDESIFIPNPDNSEEMCKAFGPSDRDIENEKFPM